MMWVCFRQVLSIILLPPIISNLLFLVSALEEGDHDEIVFDKNEWKLPSLGDITGELVKTLDAYLNNNKNRVKERKGSSKDRITVLPRDDGLPFDLSKIIPGHVYLKWNDLTLTSDKNSRRKKIRYLLTDKITENQYHLLRRDGSDAGPQLANVTDLKILIHGFTHHEEDWAMKIIRSKMFRLAKEYVVSEKPGLEIMVVDWTNLSSYPPYLYSEAADSCQFAGVDLAEFVINLVDRDVIAYNQVHMIGYSLGAHIAGVAGYKIHEMTGSKIGRITGIEPAGPMFVEQNKLISDRRLVLDKTDAAFVDIIHCNMGELYEGKLGSKVQAGHADFYPNGGRSQRGCDVFRDATRGCSHSLCPEYFLESVNTKKFPACKCSSWRTFNREKHKCNCQNNAVEMGEHLNTSIARGRYYLHV